MATKKNSKSSTSGVLEDMQGFQRSSDAIALQRRLSRALTEVSEELFKPAGSRVHDIMAVLDNDLFHQVHLAISNKIAEDHPGDEEVKKIATLRVYAYFVQVGVMLEFNRCKEIAEQKQQAA